MLSADPAVPRRTCSRADIAWVPVWRGLAERAVRHYETPTSNQRPASFVRRDRIIPLIIAVAMFMETMDSTVIATSLPAIAADLGTSPIALKLALTSYLVSLAVFIPVSGWAADRYGARTVFRAAIGVFLVGSVGCAMAASLSDFVLARIVQGMGGAMMTPVGRLVILRTIEKRYLVDALAWVTIPALIGPMLGPPLGGFITTYASWHWIFLINVPIGLAGIVLVTRFIPNIFGEERVALDRGGFLMSGLAAAGLVFGFNIISMQAVPLWVAIGLIGAGALAAIAYLGHYRHTTNPLLDLGLMALPTYRASVLGGFLFRIGVGAVPFLLPLMLQLGFGLNPFHSGLLTFASGAGALLMKFAAAPILRRFGFRPVLVVNTAIASLALAAIGLFTASTPAAIILATLLVGGFFRSLQFTAINAVAYADIERSRMSKATALSSAAQQLSLSVGVAVGAGALEASLFLHGDSHLMARDFPLAFAVVGFISLCAIFVFLALPGNAGAELSGRVAQDMQTTRDSRY